MRNHCGTCGGSREIVVGCAFDNPITMPCPACSKMPRRWCSVHNREEFKYESLEHELHVSDEVQRRMDQVVEAAVEWHQAGREGGEWFDAAEKLSATINSLLELRSTPAAATTSPETVRVMKIHSGNCAELRGHECDCGMTSPETPVGGETHKRPRIICLCGSTRFIEQFAITTWELEREGYIVLGCTLLPMWYCNTPSHFGEATGTKEQCDELHKRKIDLADEVLVLNIGGYIGESTRSEIEYANRLGKPVRYIESKDAAALRTQEGEGK